jgi:type IV secretion system protein VirB6
MSPCSVVPDVGHFAPGVIGYLDCQAQTLGAQGYLALAAAGSTVSLLLTILLTLFVAFIGYRMLFGQMPTIREGVLAFVKIGFVLALATNWPAYQRVIYNVVLYEPGNLAAAAGGAAGLPGSQGGLIERLDDVDRALAALAIYGTGGELEQGRILSEAERAPSMAAGFDRFAVGASRLLFLIGAIGAFALLRIGAGFLLAFGPLFIAFLLFEGTRGLFEGWLRALIGVALGAVAVSVVLGMELALIEPWLADLLARRAADLAISGSPGQLLAISAVFAVVLASMLAMMGRVAFSWKLPISWPDLSMVRAPAVEGLRSLQPTSRERVPTDGRPRAAIIADAVWSTQRREEQAASLQTGSVTRRVSVQAARPRDVDIRPSAPTPLGRTFTRRAATRVSARAGMRDRT